MSDNEKRTKPKYETPTVLPLGEMAKGSGADDCTSTGYAAISYCTTTGSAAGSACSAGGTALVGACTAGDGAGAACTGTGGTHGA